MKKFLVSLILMSAVGVLIEGVSLIQRHEAHHIGEDLVLDYVVEIGFIYWAITCFGVLLAH